VKIPCFKIIASALAAVALSPIIARNQALPTGWREASRTENSGAWRRKSPTHFLKVEGDFDGDGRPDLAELLVSVSGKQAAIFVKLASRAVWLQVGRSFDIEMLNRMGIDLVQSGKYETACGKGYGDYACAHGEPKFLQLSFPAIDFFYIESSESILYWG
jgi:hypothetical protein